MIALKVVSFKKNTFSRLNTLYAVIDTQQLHIQPDHSNEPNPMRFQLTKWDRIKQMQWKDGLNTLEYKVRSVVFSILKYSRNKKFPRVILLETFQTKLEDVSNIITNSFLFDYIFTKLLSGFKLQINANFSCFVHSKPEGRLRNIWMKMQI